MNSRSKWIPPDTLALQMRIKKAMHDSDTPKYFQYRGFHEYVPAIHFGFKHNSLLNGPIPFLKEDETRWIIIKAYFPLNSPISIKKGASKRGTAAYDRLVIDVPDKFPVEIETPRLWPEEARVNVRNMLLSKMKYIFKPSSTRHKSVLFLTDKNWAIADKEPDPDKSVIYNNTTGKAEGEFKCKESLPQFAEAVAKQDSNEK